MTREIVYTEQVEPGKDGLYYLMGGTIRSRVGTDVVEKDLSNFRDKEQAYEALEIWKDLEYDGAPSSGAAFFREAWDMPSNVNRSINMMLEDYMHGGWIEAVGYGHFKGPVYRYDINRAYYWAGSLGLPKHIIPYYPEWDHYLVINEGPQPHNVPKEFCSDRYLMTSEVQEKMILKESIVRGVSWNELSIDPTETIDEFEDVLSDDLYKKLQQGYWGQWACKEPISLFRTDGDSMEKINEIENSMVNLVYATIIQQRVYARLWEASVLKNPLLYYTDSVITREPLEEKWIGDEPGKFELEEYCEDGIFISYPGGWDKLPSTYDIRDFYKKSGVRVKRSG